MHSKKLEEKLATKENQNVEYRPEIIRIVFSGLDLVFGQSFMPK